MTMHLAHPALTTMGKRKGKQKWASAEQKRQAEKLELEWKNLQDKWKTDPVKRTQKAKPFVAKVNPRIAELRVVKSLDTGHTGAVNIKQTPQYTGDKIIGIGTMHKSNAVPIFNDEAAKDISKMRR